MSIVILSSLRCWSVYDPSTSYLFKAAIFLLSNFSIVICLQVLGNRFEMAGSGHCSGEVVSCWSSTGTFIFTLDSSGSFSVAILYLSSFWRVSISWAYFDLNSNNSFSFSEDRAPLSAKCSN